MVASTALVTAVLSFVVVHRPPSASLFSRRPAAAAITLQVDDYKNDGGSIDWDAEAANLARPTNPFYAKIKAMEPSEMVREFAQAAPEEVQFAVKQTVASLLGKIPEVIGESTITTTGKNLASLMFNMQMTGYMFRNAEYRQGLMKSLSGVSEDDEAAPATVSLPPVSGQITVKIAEGMEANVDAQAYMAELRSEVEGLRAELMASRQAANDGEGDETALITYIQKLAPADQQELTQTVSPEVLEAMSQLVAKLLIDLNIERETETAAPMSKMRELLIVQLVTGYRLRELQVKDDLKDKFWDQ